MSNTLGDVAGAAASPVTAARGSDAASPSRNAYAQPVRLALCVFVGYYLGARLGLALTFLPNPVSVLWPTNAVMLAAMLISPARLWWVIVAGALPAHLLAELQGGVPAPMVLSWFVSNSAEALIGAGCVRALRREPMTFNRLLRQRLRRAQPVDVEPVELDLALVGEAADMPDDLRGAKVVVADVDEYLPRSPSSSAPASSSISAASTLLRIAEMGWLIS